MAERFHVVAPDMLGFGLTDKVYSFSDPAGFRLRHLRSLLDSLGINSAFFIGNSAGGGMVLRSAVLDPSPLPISKGITICGNAALYKTDAQSEIENYTLTPEDMKRIMGILFHDPKWLAGDLVEERYKTSLIPGSWEALSATRLRRPGPTPAADPQAFKNKLSKIKFPLLIISCEHDRLNQKGWEADLQSIIPGSRVHRFKNSAHEPQIEESEAFHRVVIDFLITP